MFHRADIGGFGAGLGSGSRLTLDYERPHAAKPKLYGERQPGRARADNEHIGFESICHYDTAVAPSAVPQSGMFSSYFDFGRDGES
jgi:hypothetical protein